MAALTQPLASQCLLEWQPHTADRTMGLNHQLSSLSCMLSEAFYLGRTAVLPDRMCLFGLHTERWPGKAAAGEQCVPLGDILDIGLLSSIVPVELLAPGRNLSHPMVKDARVQVVGMEKSAAVREKYPCATVPILRRHVDRFWFSQCNRHIVDSAPLMKKLQTMIGAPAGAPAPLGGVFLRSGLFYSRAIKSAVRDVRRAIGGEYYSMHVRRSDKLTTGPSASWKSKDELTRPPALEAALRLWFPPGSRVYIGSTEKPSFFAPLNTSYRLYFAEDFPSQLAGVSNNYALYAVETLLFFASAGTVETLGFMTGQVQDSCFPAARLRSAYRARAIPPVQSAKGLKIECLGESGISVNGVWYGRACIDNPPCGTKMSLIPKVTRGCGALAKPHAEAAGGVYGECPSV